MDDHELEQRVCQAIIGNRAATDFGVSVTDEHVDVAVVTAFPDASIVHHQFEKNDPCLLENVLGWCKENAFQPARLLEMIGDTSNIEPLKQWRDSIGGSIYAKARPTCQKT